MRRKSKDLFAVLVREHELRLLAFVRSCVADPAAADDIVQETFIAAWWQLAHYDRNRPFAAWLRGIARNKILENYRNTATAQRHLVRMTPDFIHQIGEKQEQLMAVHGDTYLDQLVPLRDCLTGLAAEDRDLLDRHYAHQQTCRVIAEHFGLKLETIKKRLQRIREALRECILGKLAQEANRV